jgi:hypothetical protein
MASVFPLVVTFGQWRLAYFDRIQRFGRIGNRRYFSKTKTGVLFICNLQNYGDRSPMRSSAGFGARAPIVISHIAWEWRCAYMYKSTLYDTTCFKAVMAMNPSELRS